MKGQVNGTLTTGGDMLYDYGKLYQSFLGYDAALYGDTLDEQYKQDMLDLFVHEVKARSIHLGELRAVTRSLIIGTFHAIQPSKRDAMWAFLKTIH